jgi:hypothetical protein
MRRRKVSAVIAALGLIGPAYAVNPSQWDEFSKGEFIDTANVKADGGGVSAYVRHVGPKKEVTILYEVDCSQDSGALGFPAVSLGSH